MQYFLEFGKEFFIGTSSPIDFCGYIVGYFSIAFWGVMIAIYAKEIKITNRFIQKLGQTKKISFTLLCTFIFFLLIFFSDYHVDDYSNEVKIFYDESKFFATCFGCTLLFISLLLLLYAKNIFTKLQWKKWIFIPLFIVVQLITLFFATASLNWDSDFKYGNIETKYLDEKISSMEKYFDYEIIVHTTDILMPRSKSIKAHLSTTLKKESFINLRVQGDSVCLVGQEKLQNIFLNEETTSDIPSDGVCKWFTKDSKEWEDIMNLAQDLRLYKQEYFIGKKPLSLFVFPTEVILLDYKKNKQKYLTLPFAHERVPKATEILKAVQFYLDSWEQFKPKTLNNDKNNEETTSENKE